MTGHEEAEDGELFLQFGAARIVVGQLRQGLLDQAGGQVGHAVGQFRDVVRQPVEFPAVGLSRLAHDHLRHAFERCARRAQCLGGVLVQRGPLRLRDGLVQGLLEQAVAEPQTRPGFLEHPRKECLLDGAGERGGVAADNGGQVPDGEIRPHERGCAKQFTGLDRQVLQPFDDRTGRRDGGERNGRLPGGEVADPIVEGEHVLPDESVEQLADVEGIAPRLCQLFLQQGPGGGAQELPGQQRGALLGQRLHGEHDAVVIEQVAAQPVHLVASRERTAGTDQEERQLSDGAAQHAPHQQGRVVGPLQVVDGQDHRPARAQLIQEAEQLLARCGHRVTGHDQQSGLRGLPRF